MTESFLFAKLFYTQKSQVFELPVIFTISIFFLLILC